MIIHMLYGGACSGAQVNNHLHDENCAVKDRAEVQNSKVNGCCEADSGRIYPLDSVAFEIECSYFVPRMTGRAQTGRHRELVSRF